MTGGKLLRPLISLLLVFTLALTGIALASPAQAQTQTPTANVCGQAYVVQPGDTLSEIADLCGTSTSALIRANPQIEDPTVIFPGDLVYLPGSVVPALDTQGAAYVIESGDTLSEVAVEFDTTVNALDQANPQIEDPALVFPGQRVQLPSGAIIPVTGDPQAVAPTISIAAVEAGDTVTVRARYFPALTQFEVLMGPIGTHAIDGLFVERTVSDADGFFTETYAIPASLAANDLIAIRLESVTTTAFAYNWFSNQPQRQGESPVAGQQPLQVTREQIDPGLSADVFQGNAGLFLPASNYDGTVELARFDPTRSNPLPEIDFTQQLIEVSVFDLTAEPFSQPLGLNYLYFNLDALSRQAFDRGNLDIYHYDRDLESWETCQAQVLIPDENQPHGRLSCIIDSFGLYGIGER